MLKRYEVMRPGVDWMNVGTKFWLSDLNRTQPIDEKLATHLRLDRLRWTGETKWEEGETPRHKDTWDVEALAIGRTD